MRTYTFALLATCILGSQAIAECPTVEHVKNAIIASQKDMPDIIKKKLNDPNVEEIKAVYPVENATINVDNKRANECAYTATNDKGVSWPLLTIALKRSD